jgi:hypothetical protein
MNDGTVGFYGNGFDVKVCAAIVLGVAVLYGGIVKCGKEVCDGIALDAAVPYGKLELGTPDADTVGGGIELYVAGPCG